jgi:hypothetical protein
MSKNAKIKLKLGEILETSFGGVLQKIIKPPGRSDNFLSISGVDDEKAAMRSIGCIHTEECVDLAEERKWWGFSCMECPIKKDPKNKVIFF